MTFSKNAKCFRKKVIKKIKTPILHSELFSEIRAVYQIMWKKNCRAEHGMDNNTILRMRITCWIPKARDIHSEYVIRISFPQQQKKNGCRTCLNVTLYLQCLNTFSNNGIKMYTNRKVNKVRENKG